LNRNRLFFASGCRDFVITPPLATQVLPNFPFEDPLEPTRLDL
jgi:hypothetical protein